MRFFMWPELFLCVTLTFTPALLSSGPYECGEHGRFEYCIDEIPGCIVGCHCHPGFYFDTESKICEPNLKLLEHFPRRNSLTPTRRVTGYYTKTPILKNEIDDQVKDIKKGADDLGDWLYNQFFSEVENQVMNNTKETDLPSRRMGSSNQNTNKKIEKLLKRASKRHKNENFKKKIMRITENDSVFDVSSSNDSSNESEKNSDTVSDESDSSNDEHEHKKIVMIKKKDKPLPSFIFLPNMDTQFYPPLGLPPPPPVMPMYPMVPVPPVLPMLQMPVPFICDTKDSNETSKLTTSEIITRETTTETTTRETATTRETTTKTTPMITTEPPTPLTTTIGLLRTQNYDKMLEMFPDYPGQEYYVPPPLALEPMHRQHPRTKLHLKQRNMNSQQNFPQQIKSKNKAHSPYIAPINSNNQEIGDMMEPPIIQNPLAEPLYNDDEISNIEAPAVDNVDFKYISELIHRVDVNKTKDQEINKLNPLLNFDANKYIQRRSRPMLPRIQNKETNSAIKSLENDYYSKIGRQIASLIRNLDTQNKQETIPVNQEHNEHPKNLYLKENSPTFLWERNIRSPIAIMNSKNKFEYLKRSNELLFNLEDKVEIIATTPASLSLQEIENIVNLIEAARKEIATEEHDRIFRKFTPLNNNLNINLWPRELYQTDDKFKPSITSYKSRNINTTILTIKQPVDLNNKKTDNAMNTNHLKTGGKFPVWRDTEQNEIEIHRLGITDQHYNYLYNSSLSDRINSKYLSPMLPKQYHHRRKLNPTHSIDIDIFKQFPLRNINLSFTKRTTFKPDWSYYRPTYFPNE